MLYIIDACTVAPLFRGADGPNCKDIMNGIAFSMPSCLCQDTAVFLVSCVVCPQQMSGPFSPCALMTLKAYVDCTAAVVI